MTGPDPSPYTPVTPGDRGQDSRTAVAEGAAEAPTRGRAPQARTRGERIGAVLSSATQRVDAAVSRERSAGEGSRVWIDGAPSPADMVDRLKAGPVGGDDWPSWRLRLWQLAMVVVVIPMTAVGHGATFGWTGVLRSGATLVLVFLLGMSFANVGAETPAAPAPAAVGGAQR